MAARLLQRRSGTVTVAAAVATAAAAFALRPSTALADSYDSMPHRKPIYDHGDEVWGAASPVPAAAVAPHKQQLQARRPTPTDRVAKHVGGARRFLYWQAHKAEQQVNRMASAALAMEDAVAHTVQSLAPPRDSGERLLPGAVYVLVAAMAGTIAARSRGLLLRAALPAAFGIGAACIVLPITSRNVADLAWSFEQRVPAVADAHIRLRHAAVNRLQAIVLHGRAGVRAIDGTVTSTREAVEDWLRKGK